MIELEGRPDFQDIFEMLPEKNVTYSQHVKTL